jgi:ABC-2 type transport system ATP-binding protein
MNCVTRGVHRRVKEAAVSMAEPVIEAKGLCKRFASVQGLNSLDLTVKGGLVFGFIGCNGAGKTTTIRCLLGLLRPDSGSISVLGLDPVVDGQAIREQVGVLLADDGLYDRLSPYENLVYYGRIWRLPPRILNARIEELLHSFDLWDRRQDKLGTWSTGMRRKLAIARALIHRPRLLLLDEPFSSLDPAAAVELRQRIASLANDQSVTVLLTTHDLLHVEKCCSAIAIIKAGCVIAAGSPDQIASRKTEVEAEVEGLGLREEILAQMLREGLVTSYRMAEKSARVGCSREQRSQLGQELIRRGVLLQELRSVRNSLEDAFLEIVGASERRATLEG